MSRLVFLAALALGITALLSYLLQRPAKQIGLVDAPGGRKQHEGKVPVVGGLAMYCGLALALLAANQPDLPARSVVATLGLLVSVGTLDDRYDLRARYKFAAQIAAALFMILWSGREVRLLGDLFGYGMAGLSIFALSFTIVAVLGVINAVNMVDGLDGLAGSVTGVALAWMAAAAAWSGLQAQVWIAVLALSAVAGFLLFNLRLPWRDRAAIFMGDAGSMMLGFVLVWLSVDITQGQGRVLPPIVAVWILALPLMDMARVMFARIRKGNSPFVADRTHLHHLLLARGLPPDKIVLVMAALTAAGGAVGIGAWRSGAPDWFLFYTFLALLAAYCIALSPHPLRR